MNLERDATTRDDYGKSVDQAAAAHGDDKVHEADGFLWGGGQRRMTVGIWAWSRPFYLTMPTQAGKRKRTAVLVLDTQGMFDRKTSEHVTRSVFGLGTLLSSCMVYNIKGNISEDVLRTLSMFTEYARVVSNREQDRGKKRKGNRGAGGDDGGPEAADDAASAAEGRKPPFQHVTVLVRDSSKAEARGPLEAGGEDEYAEECNEVMAQIMREGGAASEGAPAGGGGGGLVASDGGSGIEDIRGTREQIQRCFQNVTMFEMPPPEKPVRTGRGFDGKVSSCGDEFVGYMRAFVERTMRRELEPKVLAGSVVTSHGLRLYLRAYVALFKDVDAFPSPQTVLEATADVACRNGFAQARFLYDDSMRQGIIAGGGYGHMKDDAIMSMHEDASKKAQDLFEDLAEFGSESIILGYRNKLLAAMDRELATHRKINSDSNPYPRLFLLATTVIAAVVLLVLELVVDVTCSPFLSVCSTAGDVMGAAARTLLLMTFLAVSWQFRASLARLAAGAVGADPAVVLRAIGLSSGSQDAGDAILDVMGLLTGAMGRRGDPASGARTGAMPGGASPGIEQDGASGNEAASGAGSGAGGSGAGGAGLRQRSNRKRGPVEE